MFEVPIGVIDRAYDHKKYDLNKFKQLHVGKKNVFADVKINQAKDTGSYHGLKVAMSLVNGVEEIANDDQSIKLKLVFLPSRSEVVKKAIDEYKLIGITKQLGWARQNTGKPDRTANQTELNMLNQIAEEKGIVVLQSAGNEGSAVKYNIEEQANPINLFLVEANNILGSRKTYSNIVKNKKRVLGAVGGELGFEGTSFSTPTIMGLMIGAMANSVQQKKVKSVNAFGRAFLIQGANYLNQEAQDYSLFDQKRKIPYNDYLKKLLNDFQPKINERTPIQSEENYNFLNQELK